MTCATRSPSTLCPVPFYTPTFVPAVIDVDHRAPDSLSCVVRAYDRAIRACEAFDHDRSRDAIRVLRGALELDCPTSKGFDALYAWCEESVGRRDFVGAAQCLRSLRDAWRAAVQPMRLPLPPVRTGQHIC